MDRLRCPPVGTFPRKSKQYRDTEIQTAAVVRLGGADGLYIAFSGWKYFDSVMSITSGIARRTSVRLSRAISESVSVHFVWRVSSAVGFYLLGLLL